MKLNASDTAWRVDLPRTAVEPATPAAVPADTPAVDSDPQDQNQAVRPNVTSSLTLPASGSGPLGSAAAPAVDPRLKDAKDDAAAFEAASQIVDQQLGGSPPPGKYNDVFGASPYVADAANAEMVKVFSQIIAKAPELATGALAEHVKAGRVEKEDIRAVQEFLQQKGHSVGATGADGLYGPRTHAAATAFLKGEAPSTTGSGPLMRQGASGEAVRKMQDRLKELGFDPQGADGQFGPNTQAAVRAFQAAKGLEVDGIVGDETWGALGINVSASELNAPAPGRAHSNDLDHTSDGPMVVRDGKQMRAELAPHWDRMAAAAAQAGINLSINSGYRSKEHQARLWADALRKYGSPEAARKWVAPPGNSNHQHGKALDIAMDPGVYEWLRANGSKFGFRQPMSWEPWHWEHDI